MILVSKPLHNRRGLYSIQSQRLLLQVMLMQAQVTIRSMIVWLQVVLTLLLSHS